MAFDWIAKGYKEIFIITAFASTFSSSGILDSYCLDLLGPKHKSLYGSYRLWCAVSYGLGSTFMGMLT